MNACQIIRCLLEDNPYDADDPALEEPVPVADTALDTANIKQQVSGLKPTVKYLIFPTGNRPYGGGGWSRNARHRPAPEIVTHRTDDIEYKGQSVFVDGIRRLKCNVWDALGHPVRIDYPNLTLMDS